MPRRTDGMAKRKEELPAEDGEVFDPGAENAHAEKTIREIRVRDLRKYYLYTLLGLLVLLGAQIAAGILLGWPVGVILIVVSLPAAYFPLKYHAIGCVLMYKAFAPMKTRERCRYEPTCSTYMIMAIEKYGLFRGAAKGIRRITRCRPPYGGVDYP